MPVTTYLDPAMQVWALQTRTDETGVDIEDSSAAEGRLVWRMYTEGVKGDSYEVTAAGGSMTVVVGSGVAFTDFAVVEGDTAALGNYGVLLESASQNVVVPAADLTNPRIDQIFLVIVDDPGTLVTSRIGYRQGDAAASPSAPGPDSGWEGSLLLASVAVGAGVTTISQGNITDERVLATNVANPSATFLQSFEVDGASTTAGQAITATFASVASVTLAIPTSWSSWKCYAIATWASTDTDGLGIYDVQLQIDGTALQTVADLDARGGSGSPSLSGSVVGSRTGMTTTGNRTVALHARETASQVSLFDVTIYARAVRTS